MLYNAPGGWYAQSEPPGAHRKEMLMKKPEVCHGGTPPGKQHNYVRKIRYL